MGIKRFTSSRSLEASLGADQTFGHSDVASPSIGASHSSPRARSRHQIIDRSFHRAQSTLEWVTHPVDPSGAGFLLDKLSHHVSSQLLAANY